IASLSWRCWEQSRIMQLVYWPWPTSISQAVIEAINDDNGPSVIMAMLLLSNRLVVGGVCLPLAALFGLTVKAFLFCDIQLMGLPIQLVAIQPSVERKSK